VREGEFLWRLQQQGQNSFATGILAVEPLADSQQTTWRHFGISGTVEVTDLDREDLKDSKRSE